MTSRLRPATADDIPAMRRLRLAVRENRLADPGRITEDDYRLALDERGRTWVVEEDGGVVGFATGHRDGSVWALFVDPVHEGRGHGRRLMAVVVDWLWSLGHARLQLCTGPGTRAERFYRAQGWTPCGEDAGGDRLLELRRAVTGPGRPGCDAAGPHEECPR